MHEKMKGNCSNKAKMISCFPQSTSNTIPTIIVVYSLQIDRKYTSPDESNLVHALDIPFVEDVNLPPHLPHL